MVDETSCKKKRVSAQVSQLGVSNTEVQAGYNCEGQWSFGFHPELHYQLKDMGPARTRGIIGHSALEMFYLDLKGGKPHDESAQKALSYIQDLRLAELRLDEWANPERLKLLNYLYDILEHYFVHYEDDMKFWRILDVESFHAMEHQGETDFYLPIRLDLVIYQEKGPFAGEISPLDHKFTYDFWKRTKWVQNSQLPLQIRALRRTKYAGIRETVVRRAIVNQLRTRELTDPKPHELFKRIFPVYEEVAIENIFKNHMKSAVRLAYFKRNSLDDIQDELRFALGSSACQYCDFKDICDAGFEERDPSMVIQALLKPNEYGYPPLEEIRRERS